MSRVEQEHTQTGLERDVQPRLHTMQHTHTPISPPYATNLLCPQAGLRAQGCRLQERLLLVLSKVARAQMKSQQGWVASGSDFRKLVERMESIFLSRWKKKKVPGRQARQEEARQRNAAGTL